MGWGNDPATNKRHEQQIRRLTAERDQLQVRLDAALLIAETVPFHSDIVDIISAISTECMANRATIARVAALREQARRISPSPSMSVYVADLDVALGRSAVRPHKVGQAG